MTGSKSPTIAFIGGGNMARSIIGGLVKSGWSADAIRVSDPMADQRLRLEKEFGVQCFEDNSACLDAAEVVVLAVKPQMLKQVVLPIGSALKASKPLIISIVAGIDSHDTLSWIGASLPFVRVMPNTPALVNKGVSGLFATGDVSAPQKTLASQLMESVGKVVWVEKESLIDSVTGVSGSGPAYFFKLMELMMAEAENNGLSAEASRALVIETALGAAELMSHSTLPPAELRKQVTSPGGTTHAGVQYMEDHGIDQAVRGGVRAAVLRSEQLAKEFGGS